MATSGLAGYSAPAGSALAAKVAAMSKAAENHGVAPTAPTAGTINTQKLAAANAQVAIERAAGIQSSAAPTYYGTASAGAARTGGGTPSSGVNRPISGTVRTTDPATGQTTISQPTPNLQTYTPSGAPITKDYNPTPTPVQYQNNIVNEGVNRPVLNADGTMASDTSGYGLTQPEQPQSLAEMRAEQLKQAQAQIDATQAEYDANKQRLIKQGEANMAQVSAYDVGAGLAGSPFQVADERKQQAATDTAVNQLAAQRSSDVSQIMALAEDKAQQYYQQGLENYRADRAYYTDERDKAMADAKEEKAAIKKAATDTITAIAKSGYSIDEIPKDEYQSLLAKSGMSDFEARAIWAAQTPSANATYSVQNGYMVGTYFDPHTGKPVVSTTKLPDELTSSVAPDLQNVSLADGSVVFYDANDPYNVDGSLKIIDYAGSDTVKQEDTTPNYDPIKDKDGNIVGYFDSTTGEPVYYDGTKPGELTAEQQQANQEALQTKISDIDGLINHKGLAGSVGPNVLARSAADFNWATGVRGDFIAGVKQMTNELTLDKLKEAKAQGTTFGALSEGELSLVSSAASKIASWEIKDKNGNVTGYKTTDALMKKELEKIRQFTQRAADATVTSEPTTFSKRYFSVPSIVADHPELQQEIDAMKNENNATDEEILEMLDATYGQSSFSSASGKALNSSVGKVVATYKAGEKGGQCAYWTNRRTGLKMGDSFTSKMALTDPSIKVGKPGDVGVAHLGIWTGHTFMVLKARPKSDGTVDYDVIDSNYGEDEKIRYHTFNSSKVNGFARPSKITA